MTFAKLLFTVVPSAPLLVISRLPPLMVKSEVRPVLKVESAAADRMTLPKPAMVTSFSPCSPPERVSVLVASAMFQVWFAPSFSGAEMVTEGVPPALISMPSVASCGAISRRFVVTVPGLMAIEVGVFAGIVAASKLSELILKFCSSVVTTVPEVAASDWKITSVPWPGIERAGIVPALSCDQLLAPTFQVVFEVPFQ